MACNDEVIPTDTNYNEESFFVCCAYILGTSDTSSPFDKPKSGRIAVKVVNHLGDEVMKVFRV